nr:MAG TPA: hypothetical protein [Caudoviricetes sp.]
MNKVIGPLIVYIAVVCIVAVLGSCMPTKSTTASVSKRETTLNEQDSLVQVQTRTLDLLPRRLTETNEELSEWAAERIDYNVVDYDTLGRIIRSATQTTDRNSGRQNDRHIVDNTMAVLTISQIDSLIHLSETRMMAKIEDKNAAMVERGLAWWQKVLMYLGVASVVAGLFFTSRRIMKLFL